MAKVLSFETITPAVLGGSVEIKCIFREDDLIDIYERNTTSGKECNTDSGFYKRNTTSRKECGTDCGWWRTQFDRRKIVLAQSPTQDRKWKQRRIKSRTLHIYNLTWRDADMQYMCEAKGSYKIATFNVIGE